MEKAGCIVPAYDEIFNDFEPFKSFDMPTTGSIGLTAETNAAFIRHFGVPLSPSLRRQIFGFLTPEERTRLIRDMRKRSTENHKGWPAHSSVRRVRGPPGGVTELEILRVDVERLVARWDEEAMRSMFVGN